MSWLSSAPTDPEPRNFFEEVKRDQVQDDGQDGAEQGPHCEGTDAPSRTEPPMNHEGPDRKPGYEQRQVDISIRPPGEPVREQQERQSDQPSGRDADDAEDHGTARPR